MPKPSVHRPAAVLLHFLRHFQDLQNSDGFVEPTNRVDEGRSLLDVADPEMFIGRLIRLRLGGSFGFGRICNRLQLAAIGFMVRVSGALIEIILDGGYCGGSTVLP